MSEYVLDDDLRVHKISRTKGGQVSGGAVKYVKKMWKLSDKDAKRAVQDAKKMAKIHGGSFWSWLGNAAKSVVSHIPLVGSYAKEGIDALQNHRAYDIRKASRGAVDSAVSLLPPGAKQVAQLAAAPLKKAMGGKKRKPASKAQLAAQARMRRRGKAIKKVMAETGMSMIQASKALKGYTF